MNRATPEEGEDADERAQAVSQYPTQTPGYGAHHRGRPVDPTITIIAVEHKDRLTRFGFKYIETLLAIQGRRIEVVNVTENPIEDIIADFVSILYSFCEKLYRQRRAKRKTEKLVQELTEEAQAEKNAAKEGEKANATR